MTRYAPDSRQILRAFWHAKGRGLPVVFARSGKQARRLAIRDRAALRAAGLSVARVVRA